MSDCIIDMYDGASYDSARHTVPAMWWSYGRLRYWGWIYDGRKIVGDFTAISTQAAEKALGIKFIYN